MITTLLFDLDGTLLDTEPGILGCFRHTLAALEQPPRPNAELRRYIGPPLQEAWSELVEEQRISQAVEIYRRCYDQKGKLEATPYPGIPQALQDLSGRYRLVVATSKRRTFARKMIEHFGFSPYFSGVYGVLPENLSEPKPALIRRILADLELSPYQAVMIGDRQFDMIGGRANGLWTVGALWGYGSRAELEQHGADRLCPTPADLPGVVYSFS